MIPGPVASGVSASKSSQVSFTQPEDGDHAGTFIHGQAVEHAWVRQITARHFGSAAVTLGWGGKNVTVSEGQQP